jgi:hypothetical protein
MIDAEQLRASVRGTTVNRSEHAIGRASSAASLMGEFTA